MKAFYTILLLTISNVFMTLAWYGHLQFKRWHWFTGVGIAGIMLISWGLAFFEYLFQVPANRIGSQEYGGPFGLIQLKTIQEVVSLTVFVLITIFVFKTDTFKWNHVVGFLLLVGATYFMFKK